MISFFLSFFLKKKDRAKSYFRAEKSSGVIDTEARDSSHGMASMSNSLSFDTSSEETKAKEEINKYIAV